MFKRQMAMRPEDKPDAQKKQKVNPTGGSRSEPADDLVITGALNQRQHAVMRMQQTQGNTAVRRMLQRMHQKDMASPGIQLSNEGQLQRDIGPNSEENVVTLPDTDIVVRVPASLRSAIGRTDYYITRMNDYVSRNPGAIPPHYYFFYGNKYVNRFSTLRPWLSSEGQSWIDCTLPALQTAIEDRRDANPWAFAELEDDSDAFQDFAYETHANAYVSCGICDLPMSDLITIAFTPDFKDIVTLGGVEQINDVFMQCQAEWFYPRGPAQ